MTDTAWLLIGVFVVVSVVCLVTGRRPSTVRRGEDGALAADLFDAPEDE